MRFADSVGLRARLRASWPVSYSADSARPGFGWFFGRDTLFTLYAVNSYGDTALSRKVKSYHVGPEAAAFSAQGGRLTFAVSAAPEYDLKA